MRSKKELRLELKAKLALLSDEDLHQLSLQVSQNLNQLLNDLGVIQKNLTIGVFAPFEKEPNWFLSMDKIMTAFPAVSDGAMVFKLARIDELLLSQDFGVRIMGPALDGKVVTPDVLIVPGLGFTKDGKRLGRGKGFYDKYLEKSSVVKIGIAFEMQIEKEIPLVSHDVVMDFVVTDKCIYKK